MRRDDPQGDPLNVYGDPAYALSLGVTCGFKPRQNYRLSQEQHAFNAHMSQLRISVEQGFGKVVNLWQFLSYTKAHKLGLSAVGGYYMVAVLLTNIHTCLRGSQVG